MKMWIAVCVDTAHAQSSPKNWRPVSVHVQLCSDVTGAALLTERSGKMGPVVSF